jgi:UDP-N-acetylglucosamine 2-epimerase
MSKKKIFIHILGARPNFVKASPVIRKLEHYGAKNKILHTGQHYDFKLSKLFFEEFSLPEPFTNLDVGSLPHGAQTGRMMEGIEKTLSGCNADFVVTYGDTNSTLAGALAAAKLHLPVAHIEAGLRTNSKISPEEINRRVCDHISTINFPPTKSAQNNLFNEGIPRKNVFFAGDVMYDMAINSELSENLDITLPKKFVLATIHRQENTDNPKILNKIFKGLLCLSKLLPIVLPLHPRTKKKLIEANLYKEVRKYCNVIEPQKYRNLLSIIKKADIIVSDSGGVPKEAAFLGKKSIVIRDFIIWDELEEQKWATLITPENLDQIESVFKKMLKSKKLNKIRGFGKGNAAEKIALNLLS